MKWPPWKPDREAHAKLAQAREQLDAIRGQWPDVRDSVGQMTEHRDRNHLAESITLIFRGA